MRRTHRKQIQAICMAGIGDPVGDLDHTLVGLEDRPAGLDPITTVTSRLALAPIVEEVALRPHETTGARSDQ